LLSSPTLDAISTRRRAFPAGKQSGGVAQPAGRGLVAPKPVCAFIMMIGMVSAIPAKALDPHKLISQFTHTSWTAKDGVPGPVRAIAQTPDGYLWLGTEAGLYRFDGLRFVAWEPTFGEQILGSSVWSLCTSRDGSLWIGFSAGGISQLRNGHLKNYSHADGVPDGGILSIVENEDGSIWAGGQYGLSRLDSSWHQVGAETGYPAPGAQLLFVDRRGTLWVATDGLDFGLSKDPVRRNTILGLAHNAKRFVATRESVGQVLMMAEAPDGDVWIADTSGHTVRPIMSRAHEGGIKVGGEPLSVLFDRDQTLWIGPDQSGLRRLVDLRQPGRAVLDQLWAREGLSSDRVYSALEDREGNLWFGTAVGLDRFCENKVAAYSHGEGLIPDQRLAVASTPDGNVWLAGYTSNTVQRFRQGQITTSKLPHYSRSDTTRILSLYADGNSRVWVGGSFGLAEGTDGNVSFIKVPDIENGAMVHAIARDARGTLWITVWGGDKGGGVLRLQDGNWTDLRNRVHLPQYRCRVLYGDPLGRLWLGFEDGEVAVHKNEEFRVYSSNDGLPGGRVLAITRDRAGNYWVGSEGGLSHFDHGHFVTLTKANGLPGNSVSGIVEDDEGFLWLAGSLAILRVSSQEVEKALLSPSYRMRGASFYATDGLRGLPRQREPFPTATRASDGRLWFSTSEGVVVIDPQHLPKNIVPPPVTIDALKADDRTLMPSSGLRLQPRTRNLQFEYAALSLTAPEHVQFRYKLEGYDEDWHGPVSVREVAYTNLPPRNYRFRVIACNNDGVWNDAGAILDFTVAPAWYQTDWFLLLCAVAAASIACLMHRLRVRQISRAISARFDERLAERTRMARELHDTFLQTIQGSKMVADDALDVPTDPARMQKALERLSTWLEQATQEGRAALNSLRASTTKTNDLADALRRVTEDGLIPSSMAVTFSVIGDAKEMHPIVRDEVYRIGYEAIRNAYSHSGASQLDVELRYANDLALRVGDNGTGIDPAVTDRGKDGHFGLQGMRERAGRIGGKLAVVSSATSGTEIKLIVPGGIIFRPTIPAPRSLLTKIRDLFRSKDQPSDLN
jgi:signal transduction histidine kinase/ligand-binding sensor domain-containing protein